MEPLRPLVADDPEWMRLVRFLRDRLPSCGIDPARVAGPMDIAQFPGGHSNLTYLVRFGGFELVVRCPPAGPLPPKAHDIRREYAWLAALHPLFPLAPQPYLFCEDLNVIGSVFCAMERRRGLVIRQDEPSAMQSPATRRRVSEAVVDTLTQLHAVDVGTTPLSALGRPKGFMQRQITNWTARWHASQTTLLPDLDAVGTWLATHVPPDPALPSVVHGDYKLDNVMIDAADPGRVVAVFDWEMAALGDPLVDLGILLAYWGPTAPSDENSHAAVITERPGWLTRDEIVERYALTSGRDVSAMPFYEVFALFKVAIVVQQLFARYFRGESRDERHAGFDARVTYLAARAAGCISTR